MQLIALFPFHVGAQGTWSIAYGGFEDDDCVAVCVVHDDLIIAAGSTGSFGQGSSDIYLFALNGDGQRYWSKTIGGPDLEHLSAMQLCSNGDLIMAGVYNGIGSLSYDGLLLRTDQLGNVIWQRTFGGEDWDLFHDVRELASGGFIVAGETYSLNVGGSHAWLLLLDADGELIWERTFGGSGGHAARSAVPTLDGGFVMAGSMIAANGERDALVIKVDEAGSEQWTRVYGGDSLEIAFDILETIDGGYSFVGESRSFGSGIDAYHVKLDADGVVEWQWNWGGTTDQGAYRHVYMPSGEFAIMGYTEALSGAGKDMYLQKSWVNGAFVFGRTFGGLSEDVGRSVVLMDDGFLVAGSTASYGSGGRDAYIIRTNVEGLTSSVQVTTSFDPLSSADLTQSTSPLFLYPNPSSGSFRISGMELAGARLLDASGRLVEQWSVAPGTLELHSTAPSGPYLLDAIDRDGVRRSARLFISRF